MFQIIMNVYSNVFSGERKIFPRLNDSINWPGQQERRITRVSKYVDTMSRVLSAYMLVHVRTCVTAYTQLCM